MTPVDTDGIVEAACAAAAGLPDDKRLHFSGSWALAATGVPYDVGEGPDSWSILKEAIEAFGRGVAKELGDAGRPRGADWAKEMVGALRLGEEGACLGAPEHETDLLADLAGIGLFVLTQALRRLNWHLGEYPE